MEISQVNDKAFAFVGELIENVVRHREAHDEEINMLVNGSHAPFLGDAPDGGGADPEQQRYEAVVVHATAVIALRQVEDRLMELRNSLPEPSFSETFSDGGVAERKSTIFRWTFMCHHCKVQHRGWFNRKDLAKSAAEGHWLRCTNSLRWNGVDNEPNEEERRRILDAAYDDGDFGIIEITDEPVPDNGDCTC